MPIQGRTSNPYSKVPAAGFESAHFGLKELARLSLWPELGLPPRSEQNSSESELDPSSGRPAQRALGRVGRYGLQPGPDRNPGGGARLTDAQRRQGGAAGRPHRPTAPSSTSSPTRRLGSAACPTTPNRSLATSYRHRIGGPGIDLRKANSISGQRFARRPEVSLIVNSDGDATIYPMVFVPGP